MNWHIHKDDNIGKQERNIKTVVVVAVVCGVGEKQGPI